MKTLALGLSLTLVLFGVFAFLTNYALLNDEEKENGKKGPILNIKNIFRISQSDF